MSAMKPLKHDKIDLSAIRFSPVEKTKRGGKIVFLGMGDAKTPLCVETPPMTMPFGVSSYEDVPGGPVQSYSLDLSFKGADTDPVIGGFLKFVRGLDELLLETATKNSVEWFGEQKSRDVIGEFCRKLVNEKNPQYAPTLKVKVYANEGEPRALFWDQRRAPTTMESFCKGATVKLICVVSSVWFVNKTFGVSFRLEQAQLVSVPARLQEYAFADDDPAPDADAVVADEM